MEFLSQTLSGAYEFASSHFVILIQLATILTGIFVARNRLAAIRDSHDHRMQFRMRHNAQSFSISNNRDLRVARIHIEDAFNLHSENIFEPGKLPNLSVSEIEKVFMDHDNDGEDMGHLERDLELILGNYENLALAIASGTADEEVAYELIGPTLVAYVALFYPFIVEKRQRRPRRFPWLMALAEYWKNFRRIPQFRNLQFAQPSFSFGRRGAQVIADQVKIAHQRYGN